MSERYVIKFSKGGYAKYTSHLDLLRFFKRAFRKTGVDLKYSQGFNPHPKLSFAQPLSLGYLGDNELVEFETNTCQDPVELENILKNEMPKGLDIKWCGRLEESVKSLAAEAQKAEYEIIIPVCIKQEDLEKALSGYLAQEQIVAMKRRKKDKKMIEVDIKGKIRDLTGKSREENIALSMVLDCGSASNLSPELVISSFCSFAMIDVPRYMMEVRRKKIIFYNNLQF